MIVADSSGADAGGCCFVPPAGATARDVAPVVPAGNACSDFGPHLVRPLQIPGGHHLGSDFDALAQAILRADA